MRDITVELQKIADGSKKLWPASHPILLEAIKEIKSLRQQILELERRLK